MKTKINLNAKDSIDIPKGISGKLLLQAGSGGGKSYAIRRVLEDSYGTIQHIILDTEGEFASLREKYDYILIGKGQDIVPDPRTAGLMALRLWQEKVSAIIDLYELDPEDRQIFVDNFVNAMINAPKTLWKPVLLVIDEAHEYAPETEKSKHSLGMQRLASKGRKRHIFAVFATQSIALLSKRIVASCKNKLIGYASEINDVKRAAFELGFTPNEALKLRDLDPGEFYAFGPAISKEIIKLKIGSVKTTHEGTSSAKYKVAPPSAKVKAALAKLADLPQQAFEEAKTVAELKAQIFILNKNLRDRPAVEKSVVETKVVEKPVLTDKQIKTLTSAFQKMVNEADRHGSAMSLLWDNFNKTGQAMTKALDVIATYQKENKNIGKFMVVKPEQFTLPIPKGFDTSSKVVKNGLVGEEASTGEQGDFAIGAGEMRLLKILAQHSPMRMTRSQLALFAGIKSSTGSFKSYISKLKVASLITVHMDFLQATAKGIEVSGEQPSAPASKEEVFNLWRRVLPSTVASIFNILATYDAEWFSREFIADRLGISSTTGSFKNYISILRTNNLVETQGNEVRLSEELRNF